MAATLSLSKLPSLPPKPKLAKLHSKSLPLSLKTLKCQNPPPKDLHNAQKLVNETIFHLKSASLPLTALALPFFLNPEVCMCKL